jgi:hypothetical protein
MKKEQRPAINVRLASKGLAWLDALAEENNTTRSEVIRVALSVASRHKPEIDELLKPVGVDNF